MSKAVSKVIYNSETLIDLTQDTVTPDTLVSGVTAHNSAGQQIAGTAMAISTPTASDAGKVWTAKNDGTAYWATPSGTTKIIMKKWTSADIGG